MNTLFRKAAERGGVHPIYIDKISSDFAKQIENDLRYPGRIRLTMIRETRIIEYAR